MAPCKVICFHSQFFHLQFSDGTLLAQGFSPFKIFPLQFEDGAFLAEYFSPTVFVKRHTRATLQNPGHQGTYGGGMSDAPENSKTQTQVSPGSQVPH